MYKIGEEEMIICPFNHYHVISKLRIQRHIMKCKKNYPDVKFATCFYNYSHKLKPESILAHYETCSHKSRIDSSRFYEPETYSSSRSSIKNDYQQSNFPDINVKTQFFSGSGKSGSGLTQNSQNLDSSDFESENENSQFHWSRKSAVKSQLSENISDSSDDDLEPLPLPKTVSKAFVCAKEQSNSSETCATTSQSRGFGRGKNILTFTSAKPPRTTDNLLPDLKDFQIGLKRKENISRYFPKHSISSCSESIAYSFDDTSTLKSEDISIDFSDFNHDSDDKFVFNNFDKCTKLQ